MIDKYTDKMSLRTLRVLSMVIWVGGWGSMIAAIFVSLRLGLRPVAEMPWYFWLLVSFYFLGLLYTPPARLETAPTEISIGTARLLFANAVLVMGISFFTILSFTWSSLTVLLFGYALAYMKGSAQTLLRKRHQSNHLSTSR
jgi:hypothetical protein